LISPASAEAVDRIDAQLSVLPGTGALKHRSRVHFHAFASECVATVTLYDATSIGPDETGLARLRLSAPVVLLPEDRFVLRSETPIATIGGGRVLDACPQAHVKKAKTSEWLRDLAGASFEKSIWLRIARRGVHGILAGDLSKETGITQRVLGDLVQRWIREGRMHCADEKRWLTQASFVEAREAVLRPFRDRNGGDSAGIGRSELKERTGLHAEIFDDALRSIVQEHRLHIVGDFVFPPMTDTLSNDDRSLLASVAKEYKRAGLAPPYPDELGTRLGIASAEMRRIITLLLRDGTLVRLNNDSLCADRRALAALADKIRTLRGQTLDVTAFKGLTGLSRKFAIPLMEYLDRERVTVRRGDSRLVL
jgi:selenocysteine-specific elongation factor